MENELLLNIDQLHTTTLGIERINNNLGIKRDDVVSWCKEKIQQPNAVIEKRGKNWYISVENSIFTVNSYSYTIITAHKKTD